MSTSGLVLGTAAAVAICVMLGLFLYGYWYTHEDPYGHRASPRSRRHERKEAARRGWTVKQYRERKAEAERDGGTLR